MSDTENSVRAQNESTSDVDYYRVKAQSILRQMSSMKCYLIADAVNQLKPRAFLSWKRTHKRIDIGKRFWRLILENASCFAEKANELGKCSLTKMEITLTSNVPCYTKPYRTPFALRPVVGNIISELLDSDIIRPSDSPYA